MLTFADAYQEMFAWICEVNVEKDDENHSKWYKEKVWISKRKKV